MNHIPKWLQEKPWRLIDTVMSPLSIQHGKKTAAAHTEGSPVKPKDEEIQGGN